MPACILVTAFYGTSLPDKPFDTSVGLLVASHLPLPTLPSSHQHCTSALAPPELPKSRRVKEFRGKTNKMQRWRCCPEANHPVAAACKPAGQALVGRGQPCPGRRLLRGWAGQSCICHNLGSSRIGTRLGVPLAYPLLHPWSGVWCSFEATESLRL